MPDICLKYLNLGNGAAKLNMGTLPDDAYVPTNYTKTNAFADGHIEGIDDELGLIYGGSLVKSGVADPVATLLIADYVGQVYVNTTTSQLWVAKSLAPGDWIPVAVDVADLQDVTMTSLVDGDILAYDGSGWVNTKEIGAGHNRNSVLTSAALGGAGGTVYPGDSVAPYAGTRGIVLGGSASQVYGDDSLAALDGQSFGPRSVALSQGITGGDSSFAYGPSALAGGPNAFAGGGDAQAGGNASMAFGALGTLTGMGVIAATLANSGPNLEITLPGEDWTSVFTGGQNIVIFDLGGGTHNPLTEANVLALTVTSSAVVIGDTVITVNGINVNAATCYFAYGTLGAHALAFGENVQAKGSHSVAFGQASVAWGENDFVFGDGAEVGEVGVDPGLQPQFGLAFGNNVKALHFHGQATGEASQTRVYGERVHAHGQFSATEWSQERVNFLNQTVGVGLGPLPMYADGMGGGTAEVPTFSDHVCAVTAVVVGSVDIAGTVHAAAWKLEALFRNDSGTLNQVGATTTTLIANSDGTTFAAAPVFAISGQNIRINVDDDGNNAVSLDWAARMVMVELAAR